MTLVLLYVLAMLDGMLCGFRVAARRPLVDKRSDYRKAMMRGLLWGQIAAILAAMALGVVWKFAPDRPALLSDLLGAAHRMLWLFLPYTAIVLGVLLARAIGSTDIRSATRVMVRGPMTGLRPFVTVAGVVFGIVPAARWETRLLGVFILALMLSLGPLLDRIVEIRQRAEAQT